MRPQACNEKQLGCEAPFHELIDAEYRVVYRDADHLAEDELLSGEFHLHRFGQCLEFSHEPAIWLESNHVRGRAVNGLTHGDKSIRGRRFSLIAIQWVNATKEIQSQNTMWLFGVFSVSDVDCPFWTRHLPAERRQRWSL